MVINLTRPVDCANEAVGFAIEVALLWAQVYLAFQALPEFPGLHPEVQMRQVRHREAPSHLEDPLHFNLNLHAQTRACMEQEKEIRAIIVFVNVA